MPKLSIRVIRISILLFNIGALTLLGFVFHDLLLESSEDVQVRLANPKDFELKEQAARPVPNQYRDIISDLYRTPPVPPTPIDTKPVESALPAADSGPIGDWEIVGVIFSPEGKRFASIQEKGQTSVLNPSTRGGRTVNTSRVRGSSSRRGGPSPTTRRSSRSTPGRTQVSNQRVRYLEQGESFRIDENTYQVVEIFTQPKKVIYSHNGRQYTLVQESAVDPVLHEEGNILVLKGYSPEELELLTGVPSGLGAGAASQPIPQDVRGSIRGQDGKQVPGTAARRGGGATPPATNTTRGSTRPSPAVPGRLNTPQNPRDTRRGGVQPSRKPAPKPKLGSPTKVPGGGARVTRTTVDSTLGVDIEANPQEAIRRLEELNRAQQQNQPN